MRTVTLYLGLLLSAFLLQVVQAQEGNKKQIEILENLKDEIMLQEKDALKLEVEGINQRLEDGLINQQEAQGLKEEAARKRALNIENRIAIIDNKIALLERNEDGVLVLKERDTVSRIGFSLNIDGKPAVLFKDSWKREVKYDRRTYSDFVLAIGLNNAIIEGQSLDDSPYRIGGSRFFELGWQWRTRIFKNTNFVRFNYGFSFQFNGLKPTGNRIFVEVEDNQTELQEFEFDLRKAKLRMDNLVFPIYLEFGPSKLKESKNKIRYSLHNKFRVGVGGYGGFNLGTRQKLKYNRDGDNVKDKLKRSFNTSNLIYGLSAYMGYDGVLLYAKYDLNPIFRNAVIDQRNISLGFRFDL